MLFRYISNLGAIVRQNANANAYRLSQNVASLNTAASTVSDDWTVIYVSPTEDVNIEMVPSYSKQTTFSDEIKDRLSIMSHLGGRYPLLASIKNLNRDVTYFESECSKLRGLDNELKKLYSRVYKEDPKSRVVVINEQDYVKRDRPANIKKYIEPLLRTDWDVVMIDRFSRMWATMIQNNKLHPQSDFMKDVLSDNVPKWMNCRSRECPHDFLYQLKSRWILDTNRNFLPVRNLLRNTHKYKVSDFSATNQMLLDYRKTTIVPALHNSRSRVIAGLDDAGKDTNIQCQILVDDYDSYLGSIKPFEFDKVVERTEAVRLDKMNKLLQRTPGGMSWLLQDRNIFDVTSPMYRLIMNDKEINACAQTSGKMDWTLYNLMHIHNNGWNSWVKFRLGERGIRSYDCFSSDDED